MLETYQDIDQFLKSIYRYVQLGVYIRRYQDPKTKSSKREIAEVTEFYVDEDNNAVYSTIYKKSSSGKVIKRAPSKYLIEYLDAQGVTLAPDSIIPTGEEGESTSGQIEIDPTKEVDLNVETKEETIDPVEENQNEEILFM